MIAELRQRAAKIIWNRTAHARVRTKLTLPFRYMSYRAYCLPPVHDFQTLRS